MDENVEAEMNAQYVLAFPYLSLGGWCVLHPKSVFDLLLPGIKYNKDTDLLLRCFGAQACLVGTLFSTSQIRSPKTYYIWAAAMIPFCFLDVLMYKNGQANAFGALLDFIPNVVQAGVAIWAGKRLEKKRKGKGKKY